MSENKGYRKPGDYRGERSGGLLSHWGTEQPYLVRAALLAGLPQGTQLRWLLDGVGQPDRGTHREIIRRGFLCGHG